MCVYIYMYIYVYVYICICICILYIYIYTPHSMGPIDDFIFKCPLTYIGHQSCLMTPEGRSNVVKPCKTNAINHTINHDWGVIPVFSPLLRLYPIFHQPINWGRLDWHGIYHIECHNFFWNHHHWMISWDMLWG